MSAYQAPIPPVTPAPRVGGHDRFGNPQDTLQGRVTSHQGTFVPPRPQPGYALPRRRSMVLAVLLAAFFGPLGLLYSAPFGALLTAVIGLVIAIPLAILGLAPVAVFLITPICVLWAVMATLAHNGTVALARHLAAPRR